MPISTLQSGSFPSNVAIDTDTLVVDGASNLVGVGTSAPSGAKLEIFTASTAVDGLKINRYTPGNYYSTLRQDNHGLAIHVGTGGTVSERVAITPNGITFNGDTAAANALDDYEEGNWTPQFGGSSTTGTGTYTTTVGRYVKVGKKVNCWGIIVSSGTHNGTGTLQIIGLPFNKENTYLSWGTETSIAYYFALTSFGTATNVLRLLGPVSNGSFLRFHSFQNNGDTSLPPTPANVQNGTSMYFSATYEVQ